MSSFTTGLKVQFSEGGYWRVLERFVYEIGRIGSGYKIRVPEDFLTDFASIPWLLQGLISKTEIHCKAAVVHDYVYFSGEMLGERCTQKDADLVFLEAMEVLNVSWLKRYAMYRAVRLFGCFGWCKHRSGHENHRSILNKMKGEGSSFTSGLKVEFVDDKLWKVLHVFVYEIGALGSGEKVTIGPDFVTDLASLRWPFGRLISKIMGHGNTAVLHDYLYTSQEIMGKPCTRKQADLVFLEAMGVIKVRWLQRYIMYLAVRCSGSLSWFKHRRSLA